MADPLNTAETTRQTLQRIAVHILGRRRYEMTGRFGLRASPGGFATPAFGPDAEILRVAGTSLVRETVQGVTFSPITGTTLRQLAAFAGADLKAEFSAGASTPALGNVDEPMALDGEATAVIAEWYAFGWQVLDRVLSGLPAEAQPAVVQLWPEHFDAGTNVAVSSGTRVNLGASPGDIYSPEPYLYVGPWTAARPGDARFWNAPFGAVLVRSELDGPHRVDTGAAFLLTGLRYVEESAPS
jgi:hypothetical protein